MRIASLWLVAGAAAALALGLAAAAPIGDALAPQPFRFWGQVEQFGLHRPEPEEFVRYALAAAVPVAVAGAILLGGTRALPRRLAGMAGWTASLLPVAVLALALAA